MIVKPVSILELFCFQPPFFCFKVELDLLPFTFWIKQTPLVVSEGPTQAKPFGAWSLPAQA